MRKVLGRLGNGMSEDDQAKGQVKRRYNPFRHRADEKDVPLVKIEPQCTKAKKPRTSFGCSEESSEVNGTMSPYSLKLFEAIREDEIDLVNEGLASLTDRSQINRLSGHGLALIHVAARYNFGRTVNILLDQGADINVGTREGEWTPLHLASRFNCLSTVAEVLLPRGADPNLKGKNGSIPLHLAARKGNEEIVKILLDQPAVHVDATDGSGKTALHLACSGGHEKVCRILLNYGADIKAVSEDRMTPLLCAIQSRHTEIARMILSRANDPDVETNKEELLQDEDLHSNTVIHSAVWNMNDVKTVELCVDSGADVHALKSDSVTALHLAAAKGNVEVADFLISKGASVHVKDENSKTPLHMAALFNQTKVIEFLLGKEAKLDARDSEGRSPFLNAVAAGHLESAHLLLDSGADISATDLQMKTCLHIAVENEHLSVLVMLLDRHSAVSNLSKGDIFDRVPLHYAATTKDIEILELVSAKQKRYGVFFQDEHHKTPLHLAAEMGSSKHVEVLAKNTRNINARDEKGRTALHSAARKGQRKSCLTLLTMGADVNSRDNNHRTPLMLAANNNKLKCVEVLLNFKASPDLQDAYGNSALLLACAQGHGATVTLLMDHGASLTLNNKQEFDCLELAAKAGSSDVAMAIVNNKRWTELEDYQTSNGQTAISLLIENFPEAAEVVLNRCVHHSEHLNPSDPDYAVTYNFKFLDQDPDVTAPEGRFSAVKTMIKHQRERLLLHPLTLKLNECKWIALGRTVFMSDFITYLLLMIFFTIFIVDERSSQSFRPTNSTDAVKLSDIYKHETVFTQIVPPVILLFSLIHIGKEFLQIYAQRWSYFMDSSNYLDWILYGSTLVFMVPYVMPPERLNESTQDMTDPYTLWIAGILAIFICYTNMMLFLRRYRLFGTYISMYVEVTQTVVQVMGVFVFLVLGFALVFHILFREQVGFHTVHHSILRVLVMMVGELDYGAIFIDSIRERNPENQNPLNPFPSVAFSFLYLCLFLLSVALMNLLVGLAVGDTETMKKCATIKRLEMQLQYQFAIEEAYPSFITRRAYLTVYVEKPNSLMLSTHNRVMGWLQERFAEVSPATVHESQPLEIIELKDAMTKNKKKIKSMMTLLEAQNRLLRTLVVTLDPKFEFQDGAVGTEGSENADGVLREPLNAEKEARKPSQSIKVVIIKMLSNKTE